MPAESIKTDTPLEVKYLEDIDKSRRIIDNLNLIPDEIKKSSDWWDIVTWHEDRILFYLDLLNKYYQKKGEINKE